jgi:MFS family permease
MSPSFAVSASPSSADEPDATAASWYGLATLIVVALYGVVDRQVFVLMAEPIRVNMGLNDFQLGLLNGLGVSLFAAVAGYPIGWLADRYDRRVVLACCIVVWSLAVVACGMAQTFPALFLASAVVGAGEAGITPIMFSLIPEMFRNAKRQFANALNMVVGRLGVGIVIAFCGLLSQVADASRPYLPAAMQGLENWRLTFFWAALPAPLFVLLLLWLPVRSRAVAPAASTAAAPAAFAGVSIVAFWRTHTRTLGLVFGALTVSVMGLVAVSVWLPVVAMRQFGATPAQVGSALGLATFVASGVGLLFTVYGMRWMAPRVGARLPVIALAVACASSGLALLLLPLAGSSNGLFVIYGMHMTLLMMGLMTYPTVVQDLSPAHLRARMFAIFGVLGVVFPSLMPPFIGALSDQFQQAPNGLLLVTVACGSVLLLLSSALYLWGARGYAATVRAAAEPA